MQEDDERGYLILLKDKKEKAIMKARGTLDAILSDLVTNLKVNTCLYDIIKVCSE